MKKFRSLHVCAFLVACSLHVSPVFAEIRTWTSASGARIEAEFVEVQGDRVVLKQAEGERVQIRLNQLSSEDQVYVGRRRAPETETGRDGTEAPGGVPDAIKNAFGEELVNARRERVSTADLAGKIVGLYFSAQWCPPCRAFTPALVDAYNELQQQGKPFEVVFVSHDRSEGDMRKYMRDYRMPWLAVRFADRRREELKEKYGVRGIPMLVIVDEAGNTLSTNGRGEISSRGAAAFDDWANAAQRRSAPGTP